ncbi:hypothetical protein JCGZ_23930 [Jatropha curcas]|uniref:Cytochrome P450 n=1 Tax=Jatropha curcas TaxID=180498 RepID=A0A067K0K0_JATCU|nr:hypothetical protein JCGZ_23930 [Jatropha curcas]
MRSSTIVGGSNYKVHRKKALGTLSILWLPSVFGAFKFIASKGKRGSAGKRICPGMTLGMANLEIFLANLLYHFDWKFPKGVTAENLDMNEAFGAAVKRKVDLELVPIPYRP